MSVCPYVCMSLCMYVFMSVCPYVCMSLCIIELCDEGNIPHNESYNTCTCMTEIENDMLIYSHSISTFKYQYTNACNVSTYKYRQCLERVGITNDCACPQIQIPKITSPVEIRICILKWKRTGIRMSVKSNYCTQQTLDTTKCSSTGIHIM